MKTTLFNEEFKVEIKDFDTHYMIAFKCGHLKINVQFSYEFNRYTKSYDVKSEVYSQEIGNTSLIMADDSSDLTHFFNQQVAENNHIQELVDLIEEKFNENISKEPSVEDEYDKPKDEMDIFYESIKQVFETAKLFS